MVVVLQYPWQTSSLAGVAVLLQYPWQTSSLAGVAVLLQYPWQTSSLAWGGSTTTIPLTDILNSRGGRSTKLYLIDTLASQGGSSSTTIPMADQHVETWICQFVWMYAESFVLCPTSSVDVIMGSRRSNFKERFHEMPIITRPNRDDGFNNN